MLLSKPRVLGTNSELRDRDFLIQDDLEEETTRLVSEEETLTPTKKLDNEEEDWERMAEVIENNSVC